MSTTTNSPEIQDIVAEFHPTLVDLLKRSQEGHSYSSNCYNQADCNSSSNFPATVKIVWESSDNKTGGECLPVIKIDAKDGELLLASWTGVDMLKNYTGDKRARLLELPWSVYAQSRCLSAINSLVPEVLIYSPDKYAVVAPQSRDELTHSADKIYSTSICGGFSISQENGAMTIETMKALVPERK